MVLHDYVFYPPGFKHTHFVYLCKDGESAKDNCRLYRVQP